MTRKEIEAARATLPRLSSTPWKDWTEDQKHLYNELSCRTMVNSCLTYGGIENFWTEHSFRRGDKSYAAPHIRELGLKRVREIVAEQEADFAKAKVFRNAFTDSEGCTYNSVQWADE